jgi:transposase
MARPERKNVWFKALACRARLRISSSSILDMAMPLPPAAGLALSHAERKQLAAVGSTRSSSQLSAWHCSAYQHCGAAEGLANRVVARKLSTSVPTVLLWRKRSEADGIAGLLQDRPRSGRPERISEQTEAAIVEATMKTTPKVQFGDDAANLEETQAATASRRVVQVQQRSAVCVEGSRRCGAL